MKHTQTNDEPDKSQTENNTDNENNEEIAVLKQQTEEYRQKYLRALADYQNLEKRVFAEKEEIKKFAAEVTLRRFLPALDNLERALKHIENKGLTLAMKEFESALEGNGVKRMNIIGKPFDPFAMECIEVVEGEDGVVVEVVTTGYTMYEKVLRVAQVKVGKKSNN